MRNADRLAPGTLLGRYEVGRLLGRGGMGAVYQAVHRDLRKQVALKVLSSALSSDDVARQRFLREGEAASRIRHPHVVDITDVGAEGDFTYLVMELLEGEDLATRIQRGPLEPQEAVDLLLPVLAGVHAAHQEGIVHRDLKPENIFLARQRQGGVVPKVLDFGVSKLASDGRAMALTGTAAVFGTPFYMPPEQIRGARQADHRSDQYALGVVLYEALTGRRPYDGDNVYAILHAIGSGQFARPRDLRPQIPEALEADVLRAMALEPPDRFPSVAAFGGALLAFAGDLARAVWTTTFRSAASAASTTAVMPGDAANLSETPTPPPLPAGTPPGPTPPGSISGTRLLDPPVRRSGTTLAAATGQVLTDAGPRKSLAARGALAVIGLGTAGVAAWFLLGRPTHQPPRPPPVSIDPVVEPAAPQPPTTFALDVTVDPPAATFELDGTAAGSGRLRRTLDRDGAEHRLIVSAAGYRDAEIVFADHPPPARLVLSREPASARTPAPSSAAHAEHHRRRLPPAAHAPAAEPQHPPREPSITRTANGAPVLD